MTLEFLVEIIVSGTDAVPMDKLERLRALEASCASELAHAGTLQRLWRTDQPGWGNVGLWRAESETALDAAIASLPLSPYMSTRYTLLMPHPNDPGHPARSRQPEETS